VQTKLSTLLLVVKILNNYQIFMKEVEKFKAAEEQLITAIDLFFNNKSEISVHTLVRAAHEIFDKLCEHKNLQRGVVYEGMKGISDEKKKLVFNKINEAKNFFKHADKDPEVKITWNPELSTYYIWDSTSLYRRLNNEKIPYEILIFSVWFRVQNNHLWDTPSELDALIPDAKVELANIDKSSFYEFFLKKCKDGSFTIPSNPLS